MDHPSGALASALTKCGVDPKNVSIEYDDLCQEEVLTFAEGPYSASTLASLAELFLTFGCSFVFPDEMLQERFEKAVQSTPQMLTLIGQLEQGRMGRIEAAGLSEFRSYDPSTETLEAFAHRVEAAVGFQPGQTLYVGGGDTIVVAPTGLVEFSPDKFNLLLGLLERAAPQISVLLTIGSEEKPV